MYAPSRGAHAPPGPRSRIVTESPDHHDPHDGQPEALASLRKRRDDGEPLGAAGRDSLGAASIMDEVVAGRARVFYVPPPGPYARSQSVESALRTTQDRRDEAEAHAALAAAWRRLDALPRVGADDERRRLRGFLDAIAAEEARESQRVARLVNEERARQRALDVEETAGALAELFGCAGIHPDAALRALRARGRPTLGLAAARRIVYRLIAQHLHADADLGVVAGALGIGRPALARGLRDAGWIAGRGKCNK